MKVYVIESTAILAKKNGERFESKSYYKETSGTFSSLFNHMETDVSKATHYEFISDARRVKRERFGRSTQVKIVPFIPPNPQS